MFSRRSRSLECGGNNAFLRIAMSANSDTPPMQALALESLSDNSSAIGGDEEFGSVRAAVINALRNWECRREEERLLTSWDEWAAQKITSAEKCVLRQCSSLPQVIQLLSISAEALCISTDGPAGLSTIGLEWALLTPRSSTLLSRIMSSLLARHLERPRLTKNPQPVSYSVWEERVRMRLANWYRLLPPGLDQYPSEVVEQICSRLGFEAALLRTLGWSNPLLPSGPKHFHELSLLQRVHVLKALADWCIVCQETLRQQLDQTAAWDNVVEHVLGRARLPPDNTVWVFVHFQSLDDSGRFRVYRRPSHPLLLYRVEPPPLVSKKRRRKATSIQNGKEDSKEQPPQRMNGGGKRCRRGTIQNSNEDANKDSLEAGRSAKRPRIEEDRGTADRRRNMTCRYRLRGVLKVDSLNQERDQSSDVLMENSCYSDDSLLQGSKETKEESLSNSRSPKVEESIKILSAKDENDDTDDLFSSNSVEKTCGEEFAVHAVHENRNGLIKTDVDDISQISRVLNTDMVDDSNERRISSFDTEVDEQAGKSWQQDDDCNNSVIRNQPFDANSDAEHSDSTAGKPVIEEDVQIIISSDNAGVEHVSTAETAATQVLNVPEQTVNDFIV